jgi:hypothetical protein
MDSENINNLTNLAVLHEKPKEVTRNKIIRYTIDNVAQHNHVCKYQKANRVRQLFITKSLQKTKERMGWRDDDLFDKTKVIV